MLTEVNERLYSKQDKSILNIVLNVLLVVVAIVVIFEAIFASLYSGIYVVGPSMNYTLTGAETETVSGGDYVYVNRYAKPDYGDIVVVNKDNKLTIIKRVIALGGDSVKLINGELYIKYAGNDDFEHIEESYVSPDNNIGRGSQPITFPTVHGIVKEEGFYVEEGHMFLLGDNRDVSLDSREGGGRSYALTDLYGVVAGWSLKHKGLFTSVHRFFSFDLPQSFGIKK